MSYPDDMPLEAAREVLFSQLRYGGGGGYERRWVKLRVGPLQLAFPNFAARRRAVRLHDLHHIATEYPPKWKGEAEIAAWELAAGCGRYWAAWLLNWAAFTIGIFLWPSSVFHAFVRGRSSTTLYRLGSDRDFLADSVGDLRKSLGLPRGELHVSLRDVVTFLGFSLGSLTPLILLAFGALLLVSRF